MNSPRYTNLRDYLRVLRDNAVIIVAIALLGGGVAVYLAERKPQEYQASATMSFQEDTRQLELLGAPVSSEGTIEQLPATRARSVASIAVANRVQRALNTKTPPAVLASRISASVGSKSGLVSVTATDSDPRAAAQLADEFAIQSARLVNQSSRARFARGAANVRRRLRRTGPGRTNDQLRASYAEQLARLNFLSSASTPARVLGRPATAGAPIPKNTVRNGALGVLLGLILGIVVAFVRDVLDRRVRGTGEIESKLRLPVIGRLRMQGMGVPVAPTDTKNERLLPEIESFRIIRQNLEFLADGPLKTVAVTSAIGEEGKSTVAASLAAASAAMDRPTLLVECDLRRPSLAPRLGLEPGPGLTDFLLGEAEASEILQSARPTDGRRPRKRQEREWPDALVCVSAGRPTAQPAELLGSRRFSTFLSEASSSYDLVVLDTSPLLPVADTLELLPQVDSILLCVRSGRTTLEQATAGKAAIDHFPVRPVGVVVTGLKLRDERGYRTYYGAYEPTTRVTS